MYHKILVPVSFDDDAKISAALDVARTLAAPEAAITLLHVMEHIPAYAMHYMPLDLSEATREGLMSELARLAAQVPNGHGALVEGHAGRTILDYAEEHGNDCIIIASHRPAMADYLLGSTAAQVVRHAVCAVMVVR
ncbi:universal stress protein [Aliiruegeria sabulilitoris]|uniref:universal stress protein n=1 Tax=Aliiruegeria sabulilitoris TaxID=1510458 RepID=UPI0008351936|nr:universal stress protein [Aliiruegeria sabulilitoris]NDR56989.1 universal stress protein [Pseudoruegeria sp. M32A2M]